MVEGDAAIPDVSGPIVPDNPRLLDSERFGKSMNADGGGFHVQTIGRNGRLSDPGRSSAITVNFSPSTGNIGVHMRDVSA